MGLPVFPIGVFAMFSIVCVIRDRQPKSFFLRALGCFTIIVIGGLLLHPFFDPDFPAPVTIDLMMRVAMVWMLAINMIYQILDGVDKSKARGESWVQFLGSLCWYMFPVNWAQGKDYPRLTRSSLSLDNVVSFLRAISEFALRVGSLVAIQYSLAHISQQYLLRCVDEDAVMEMRSGSQRAYVTTIFYTAVHSVQVVCAMFTFEILRIVVAILSLGNLEYAKWNDNPFVSSSIAEFWGVRYNRIVHQLLVSAVYKPLLERGYSKRIAVFACFFVSGVLHVNVVYTTFGEALAPAMAFFMIQLVAMFFIDPFFVVKRKPSVKDPVTGKPKPNEGRGDCYQYNFAGHMFTVMFLACTLPLYLGTMVKQGSRWLGQGDVSAPAFATTTAQMLPCILP
eukprot:m.332422 g.332422  ORF g.332422 m.332422 type:complete len:394 (+) comp16946_c0_seq1:37-1218(+)